MITRNKVLKSPDYWFTEAQNELFRQVISYMEEEGLNKTQLAERLGVTKGYVSQILKGDFNYTLKTLIQIGLAIGKVPQISYRSVAKIMQDDLQATRNSSKIVSKKKRIEKASPVKRAS